MTNPRLQVLQRMRCDLMEHYFELGEPGYEAACQLFEIQLENGTITAEQTELVLQ